MSFLSHSDSKGLLAPPYLGSLYAQLDDYIASLIKEVSRNHADSIFYKCSFRREVPVTRIEPHRVPHGGQGISYTNGQLKGDKGLEHAQASGVEVIECDTITNKPSSMCWIKKRVSIYTQIRRLLEERSSHSFSGRQMRCSSCSPERPAQEEH